MGEAWRCDLLAHCTVCFGTNAGSSRVLVCAVAFQSDSENVQRAHCWKWRRMAKGSPWSVGCQLQPLSPEGAMNRSIKLLHAFDMGLRAIPAMWASGGSTLQVPDGKRKELLQVYLLFSNEY